MLLHFLVLGLCFLATSEGACRGAIPCYYGFSSETTGGRVPQYFPDVREGTVPMDRPTNFFVFSTKATQQEMDAAVALASRDKRLIKRYRNWGFHITYVPGVDALARTLRQQTSTFLFAWHNHHVPGTFSVVDLSPTWWQDVLDKDPAEIQQGDFSADNLLALQADLSFDANSPLLYIVDTGVEDPLSQLNVQWAYNTPAPVSFPQTPNTDLGDCTLCTPCAGATCTCLNLPPPNDFCNVACEPSNCASDQGHGTGIANLVGSSSYGLIPGLPLGVARARFELPCGCSDSTVDSILNSWTEIRDDAISRGHSKWIVTQSFGGEGEVAALNTMYDELKQEGMILVAAGANDYNEPASNFFPCNVPDAICVGSHSSTFQRGVSTYGSEIDIWAPGNSILTHGRVGPYSPSGTSLAAPIFAASLYLYGQKYGFENIQYGEVPAELKVSGLLNMATFGTGSPNALLNMYGSISPRTLLQSSSSNGYQDFVVHWDQSAILADKIALLGTDEERLENLLHLNGLKLSSGGFSSKLIDERLWRVLASGLVETAIENSPTSIQSWTWFTTSNTCATEQLAYSANRYNSYIAMNSAIGLGHAFIIEDEIELQFDGFSCVGTLDTFTGCAYQGDSVSFVCVFGNCP